MTLAIEQKNVTFGEKIKKRTRFVRICLGENLALLKITHTAEKDEDVNG